MAQKNRYEKRKRDCSESRERYLKMIINSNLLKQLPQALQSLNTFVLWEHYLDDSEPKKRPFDWRTSTGRGKGNDDPNLHLNFHDAVKKIEKTGSDDVGLAIYQPEDGTPIICEGKQGYLYLLDLDGFVASIQGKTQILGLGKEIVELCNNSYFEISPSGRGVKIYIVSDMPPAKKRVFKLPPNEFAVDYPDVKKYSETHAVEVFSKGYWNCVTGDVWANKYLQLKFVSEAQLEKLFTYLESFSPTQKAAEFIEVGETPHVKRKLTKESLITLLSMIDNQLEETWSAVANSLARIHGVDGEEYFIGYSKGEYNNNPYVKFDEVAVRNRFRRALKELGTRPNGYGITHLCELAGVAISTLEFEQPVITIGAGITAEELSEKVFPPLNWAIQDILPEGCYLLSARPKTDKSWLALQICLAVAFGETVFGKQVVQGKAVYLALEDNHRRLQSRLSQLRPQGYSTPKLLLHTRWEKFDKGGVGALVELIETERPKIVVIDTLAKVRPTAGRNNVYESDYKALEPITEVANKYRCTILIVTHNRKGKAETDPLEQVSGSLGLTGAVDGVMIIDGNRSDKMYNLSLIGRDIPNDDDLAIARQANGEWRLLGAAKAVFISEERQAITDLLKLHPKGLKPKEIAELLEKKESTVRKLLASMTAEQQVNNHKGIYTYLSNTPTYIEYGSSSSSEDIGNSGSNSNSGNASNSSSKVTLEEVQE